jgi:hypothetical protein
VRVCLQASTENTLRKLKREIERKKKHKNSAPYLVDPKKIDIERKHKQLIEFSVRRTLPPAAVAHFFVCCEIFSFVAHPTTDLSHPQDDPIRYIIVQ